MKHMKNFRMAITLQIITIFPFFSQTSPDMAYYTDLSETINGEKYMSIFTYKNTYITGRLRDMDIEDITKLLNNRGYKGRYSNIKPEKEAMLQEGDPMPDYLYPLTALKNIDGNLILADFQIKNEIENKNVALNSKGEIHINKKIVGKIIDRTKITDPEDNIIAIMTNDYHLMDTKNNILVKINPNGSFESNNKYFEWDILGNLNVEEKRTSINITPADKELFPTSSAIYYVFLK